METDVVIVGAGAAGLIAARELGRAGKKVLILEARDRIGGRIYPLPESEWGYPAQGGGEFVHGEAPITCSLIEEAGLTLTHSTEWWNVRDGEATKINEISPVDPRLREKLTALTSDMTVAEFFGTYFPEKEYDSMREYVYRWVEGYDAGDPARAGIFGLRDDMLTTTVWQQRSLKETYAALLEHLRKQCLQAGVEIALNAQVVSIDYSASKIVLYDGNNSNYGASKVLVTVPLPIYERISFMPSVSLYQQAAKDIGFGPVIKILLRFKTKWWTGIRERKFERMFFLFSKTKIPTWWTQYPAPYTTLTGWVAGQSTAALTGLSDELIVEAALNSLSEIFNIPLSQLHAELLMSKVNDWLSDPFALGAYSYPTPQSASAIAVLRTPIDGKVYFAGEALNDGGLVGTVEAALTSGTYAANKILGS